MLLRGALVHAVTSGPPLRRGTNLAEQKQSAANKNDRKYAEVRC